MPNPELTLKPEEQCKLFGCDLVDLLRREGHHSGVWFAKKLLQSADVIEAAYTRALELSAPVSEPTEEMIEAGATALWCRVDLNGHTLDGVKRAALDCYTAMRKLEPVSDGDVERQVLMWLGYWRDELPPNAIKELQEICSEAIAAMRGEG